MIKAAPAAVENLSWFELSELDDALPLIETPSAQALAKELKDEEAVVEAAAAMKKDDEHRQELPKQQARKNHARQPPRPRQATVVPPHQQQEKKITTTTSSTTPTGRGERIVSTAPAGTCLLSEFTYGRLVFNDPFPDIKGPGLEGSRWA